MLVGDFLARLGEFGSTIISYWYVWITGAPFVIDQGLSSKYLPINFIRWVDEKWPETNRHRFFKWLCLVGFVIASFQAFDHVNQEVKRVSAELQTTKTELSTKKIGLEIAQQALADTRQKLAEANAKTQMQTTPSAEQPKAAFDLDDDADVKAKMIQTCGEITVVKGRGSSKLDLQNGSFVAPNTVCQFPPPTEEMKRLSNKELKERAAKLSRELQAFKTKLENQIDYRMKDNDRRALEDRFREEFKSLYLERGAALASAILARIDGPVEIHEPADGNMQGMKWAFSTRLGRSSLYFRKPIGIDYAGNVDGYLKFIAEKLPE